MWIWIIEIFRAYSFLFVEDKKKLCVAINKIFFIYNIFTSVIVTTIWLPLIGTHSLYFRIACLYFVQIHYYVICSVEKGYNWVDIWIHNAGFNCIHLWNVENLKPQFVYTNKTKTVIIFMLVIRLAEDMNCQSISVSVNCKWCNKRGLFRTSLFITEIAGCVIRPVDEVGSLEKCNFGL